MLQNKDNDRLKGLFQEALLLDGSARAGLLDALPETQRQELASLLEIDDRASRAGLFESFQRIHESEAVTVGRRLGAYQIESKLGQGGMGTVFQATHEKLKRTVAVKVLPSHRLTANDVARFEREMAAAGQVSHPNIVTAFDAGEADGHHYLAMELVDGFNLSQICRACGPLEIGGACELIRQAAVGLQHAHESGMVHRDIKPSNLMLTPAGYVKILDLGLARVQSEMEHDGLTGTGQLMGTIDYMAPEQGTDPHHVDIRADIYSLGVTLFKLLTGQVPHTGSEAKKLIALAVAAAPSIKSRRSDLPADLVRIVDRMVRRDPAERFAEPQEVAIALAPFSEDDELQNLLDTTAASVEAANRRLDSQKKAEKETDDYRPQTLPEPVSQHRIRTPQRSEGPVQQPRSAFVSARWKKWLIVATCLSSLAALLLFVLPRQEITVETETGRIVVVTEGQETPITINGDVVSFRDPTDQQPVTVSVNEDGNQLTFRKAGFLAVSREVDLSSESGQKISLRFKAAKLEPISAAPSGGFNRTFDGPNTIRRKGTGRYDYREGVEDGVYVCSFPANHKFRGPRLRYPHSAVTDFRLQMHARLKNLVVWIRLPAVGNTTHKHECAVALQDTGLTELRFYALQKTETDWKQRFDKRLGERQASGEVDWRQYEVVRRGREYSFLIDGVEVATCVDDLDWSPDYSDLAGRIEIWTLPFTNDPGAKFEMRSLKLEPL